jgi:tRNA pseudouridine38-40 synthase
MQRIALGVEYDGSNYCGFQRQLVAPSIQAELEKSLSKIAAEPISIVCSGRTDSGVHACQQVIHFDTLAKRDDIAWVLGVNAHLPKDIKVLWMKNVPNCFNARKSAFSRKYLYVIYNSRIAPGLMQDKLSWIIKPLNVNRMQRAANYLVGKHDFSSFQASGCQALSPVRTIKHIKLNQKGNYIFLEIKANAFLYNMVRNIVGSLIPIGQGEAEIDIMLKILLAKDRKQAGITAKPNGLYFIDVEYDPKYKIPPSNNHFWYQLSGFG